MSPISALRFNRFTFLAIGTTGFALLLLTAHYFYRDNRSETASPALEIVQKPSKPGYLPPSAFNFTEIRPEWLDPPLPLESSLDTPAPWVLRIGIISHPKEFERREAVRKYVLKGVPKSEAVFVHKFMLGFSGDSELDTKVTREIEKYGDVERFDMVESMKRMGEKRWRILQWIAQEPPSKYDFFLGADTDAFLRIAAMPRRLKFLRPDLHIPRAQSIMWGHMLSHKMHFHPSDNDTKSSLEEIEDEIIDGPWFQYPAGIAFLLSSALVGRLTAPGVRLARNIAYPADDVVIGSWVNEIAPDTEIIHDIPGFHDPPLHNFYVTSTWPVTYDTVCSHHLNPVEFEGMRQMKEFAGEWDD